MERFSVKRGVLTADKNGSLVRYLDAMAEITPEKEPRPEAWNREIDQRIAENQQSNPCEDRVDREFAQVHDTWNTLRGVRKVRKLTPKRAKLLRKRLQEPDWDWKAAMAMFPLECFSDGNWTPGFDWFLRSETVNNILEGQYEWSK